MIQRTNVWLRVDSAGRMQIARVGRIAIHRPTNAKQKQASVHRRAIVPVEALVGRHATNQREHAQLSVGDVEVTAIAVIGNIAISRTTNVKQSQAIAT